MKSRQEESEDRPKKKKKEYQKRHNVKSKLKNIDLSKWEDFVEDSYKGNTNARNDGT